MKKKLLSHIIKSFFLTLLVFSMMIWLATGKVHIIEILPIVLWMMLSMFMPLLIWIKIMFPHLNGETKEERIEAFKEHHIGVKLTAWFTLSLASSLIVLWLILPGLLLGLHFWEAVAAATGIGFATAVIATLITWHIIRMEKPPFYERWKESD